MSDWEADDFDPFAQVADKVVALGLDYKEEEKADENSNAKNGDLTEKQKLAMQMKSDADIGLDLLGIENDAKKSWTSMRKASEFAEYAEDIAEHISANRGHPQYLSFVCNLIDSICKPMNKLQLEAVTDTVNKCMAPHKKKEEELKKRQEEEKAQAQTKKQKQKELYEDIVQDEYDDYDAKYFS